MAENMISIREAAAQGIERLREPQMDHLKIDIVDGAPGPWVHLYCPTNKSLHGRDPVDIFALGQAMRLEEKCYLPYTGDLPDSDAYKASAAACERFKSGAGK